MFDWLKEQIEIRRHNAAIHRQWREDGKPIVETTIGWRPDPWHKRDGFTDMGDGTYSRLVRGGTEEYRKKFEKGE